MSEHNETRTNGSQTEAVEVEASHHTFLLSAIDADPTEAAGSDVRAVATGADNIVAVQTVVSSGPVAVSIEFANADITSSNTDAEWDRVGNVTIASDRPMVVMDLNGEVYDRLPTVPPSQTGFYAVRILARQGNASWDETADSVHETFVVQVRETSGPTQQPTAADLSKPPQDVKIDPAADASARLFGPTRSTEGSGVTYSSPRG